MSVRYICSVCGTTLIPNGDGLRTFSCPLHPYRYVTVTRDLSGGKEHDKQVRNATVTVRRHTKAVVRRVPC